VNCYTVLVADMSADCNETDLEEETTIRFAIELKNLVTCVGEGCNSNDVSRLMNQLDDDPNYEVNEECTFDTEASPSLSSF